MENNKTPTTSIVGKNESKAPWWMTILVAFVTAIGLFIKSIVSENNQNQKDCINRQDKYIQSLTTALNRSTDALQQVLNEKRNESLNNYNLDSINVLNPDKSANAGNANGARSPP